MSKQPPRIALYLGRQGSRIDGMSHYARELALGMSRVWSQESEGRPELLLFGSEEVLDDEFARSLPRDCVTLYKLRPCLNRYFSMICDQLYLPIRASFLGVNIIHSTANLGLLFWPKSQVVTVHDIFQAWPRDMPNGSWQRAVVALYRILFNLQFFLGRLGRLTFVCDTREVVQEIKERYGLSDRSLRLIPPALDCDFQELVRKIKSPDASSYVVEGPSPPEKPGYVFVFSSTNPRKNTERTLRAWISLGEMEKSRGLFVKCSSEKDLHYAKSILEEHACKYPVYFSRWLSRESLLRAYSRASVICIPTIAEGFGYPALEAVSLGVPLVSAELEVLRDKPEHSFLVNYCDPTRVESIGEALLRAIDSSSEARACSKGVEGELVTRTMVEVACEMAKTYSEVLRGDAKKHGSAEEK